ncbi:MAG: response regulator transcription factor [Clostridia bacterium]|nr:response regulator transcription factor [Clostridia bacterium]MBQ8926524.1 response regulator transcription factor [Clostridia bacterium]
MAIYCLEDDKNIRELMTYTLDLAGFEVKGFPNAEPFWTAVEDELPELILLDIMLPGEDGISVLKRLRKKERTKDVPVIMATAKGTEYDKVVSLDLGADDYLVKPFGMMEMVSRIKAVLRRAGTRPVESVMEAGPVTVDPQSRSVTVNGNRVALTLKEYDLLCLFLSHPGQVFTREELLRSVWGTDFVGESRTIDVHIGTLRTKLGAGGRYIETVRGVGYKMVKEL